MSSVRLTLDDTGAPVTASALAYSPFGTPQSGASPEPFGFTGEMHHNDLVYLRARWYDPGTGTLLGRDPFAGYATLPYSLHPYQYAYAAPTMWTDPSGEQVDDCDDPASRTCPLFADGWIAANKADILAAAKMHERPEVGFDELTLAILMGAILITENNYREVVADEDWPHIPRRTKGDLAGVTRESWDSSSGPGNITISAANRAFDGTVRVVAGVDYSDPNDPRFIYLELCSSETVSFSTQTFYDELLDLMHRVPNGNNLISDEKMVMLSTLKNTRHNLDVMATILAQGIIAAHALRLQPTFFNLGTWYNGSVLKTEHIEIRGNAGYGASIAGLNAPAGDLGSPQRAARALNLADHIIPRSIIASEDERMLYDEVVGR